MSEISKLNFSPMNRIKRRIEYALGNNWSTDNQKIQVHVSGHSVKLHGTVDSSYQKDQAARLAWNAPDVWSVDNELVIGFSSEMAAEEMSQASNNFRNINPNAMKRAMREGITHRKINYFGEFHTLVS